MHTRRARSGRGLAADNVQRGKEAAEARRRNRQKRVGAAEQRVLWRWCNQRMPAAWDLDQELPEGSEGAAGRGAVIREGLAVVRHSGQWWSQLVRRALSPALL